jgi:AraC-like DNA-binding protein
MHPAFKNLSFSVSYWRAHTHRFPSLLPLHYLGTIPRKTSWVHSAFATANFSLILDGGGEFQRKGRIWTVEAPCVITQWPGELLDYGPSAPHAHWSEFYMAYEARLMPRLRECRLVDMDRPVWPMANPHAVRAGLDELQELAAADDTSGRADRVAERLLLETMAPSLAETDDNSQIAHAISSVRATWRQPLDIDALAFSHGMSLSTLRRRWQERVGSSPARYHTHLRLQAACRLLVETKRPLAAIAEECGFGDEFYFSRRFSKELGMPPGRYRRLHQLPQGLNPQAQP